MFYTKFANLCYKAGKTPSAVAQEIGINKSSVSYWKKHPELLPKTHILQAIAKYFSVPLDYLTGKQRGIGDPTPEVVDLRNYGIRPIEATSFPILGEIACGEPIFAAEEKGVYIKSGTDIQADFCLTARGDSMTGARIYDGDIVFIRAQSIVDNGEIAVVIVEDEATLKRVYYYPNKNTLILKAANPLYEDLVLSDEELEKTHIIGKAVAFQSALN